MPSPVATREKVVRDVRAVCKKNADAGVEKKYAKYFKEGYDAYGVASDVISRERKRILALHRDELGLPGFLDVGDDLMASGKYEEGFFAIGFAAAFVGEYEPATLKRFAAWLEKGVGNWAHADVLCGEVLERFLTDDVVTLDAFAAWRKARSKWRRRAVPVTALALLRTPKDIREVLAFIGPMMLDEERVVHQGLGWFLREAWKKYPRPVEAFLLKFKDAAPRLIFQYATEKMTPEQKQRFRRSPR